MADILMGMPELKPLETVEEGQVLSTGRQFTPEEQKQIDAIAEAIDLKDDQMAMKYASATQSKLNDFANNTLKSVYNKDMGELGQMLTDLTMELKYKDEPQRGFTGWFKKKQKKIDTIRQQYIKSESTIDTLAKELEQRQIVLLKDIATFEQLYKKNKEYFVEISIYIEAGKRKIEEAKKVDLETLRQKAITSGLPEDANEVNDFTMMIDRFEKKIYDLELTRQICLQSAPQIRQNQNNDVLNVEKIQSVLANTIPLWKNQMILALGIEHAKETAEAMSMVSEATNEMLKQNADTLKMATVETAREAERGIVDIETLQHTNEQLISTIDEIIQIQEDGRTKRKEAEAELEKIESQLQQKLMETSMNASAKIQG